MVRFRRIGKRDLVIATRFSAWCATIVIDGVVFGQTDRIVSGVPTGNRNLTPNKTGHRPATLFVRVPGGDLKVLPPVTLERS